MDVIACRKLAETFGLIVQSSDRGATLDLLADDRIVDQFSEAGAILFTGFSTTLPAFEAFTSRFLSECVVNGNATRQDVLPARRIQTVNGGNEPIPLHAEMAYGPARPDLLFFHCVTPPQSGTGATLLCDGVHVWREMAPPLRRCFEEQRVRYRFQHSPMIGAQLRNHEARFANDERVRVYRRYDDGSADLEFVAAAAEHAHHDGRPAFANSVIVEAESCDFDDGREIGAELRMALFGLTMRLSHKVSWQAGDILMIDNSRVMHGRSKIRANDPRSIVVRMGWARANVVAARRGTPSVAPPMRRGGNP